MAVVMLSGPKAIYGIVDERPIIGIPPEAQRVKLRFRNNDWARAFVRTPNGIREFIIVDNEDGTFALAYEQARNQRMT